MACLLVVSSAVFMYDISYISLLSIPSSTGLLRTHIMTIELLPVNCVLIFISVFRPEMFCRLQLMYLCWLSGICQVCAKLTAINPESVYLSLYSLIILDVGGTSITLTLGTDH